MPHTHDHIDGECYPSVTSVIAVKPDEGLKKWREWKGDEEADRIMHAAGAIGTRFHDGIERLVKGEDVEEKDPAIYSMLEKVEEWTKEHALYPLMQEVKVWSKKHRYQGTFDLVGLVDGVLVVLDWKTSSKLKDTMALQLIAYAKALEEMAGLKIEKGIIVRIDKKPPHKLEVKDWYLNGDLFNEFLELRKEYGERTCDGTAVNRNILTGSIQ